jgi:hypothetical protein
MPLKMKASMTYSFCAMSSKQTASTKRISAEKPFSESHNPFPTLFNSLTKQRILSI